MSSTANNNNNAVIPRRHWPKMARTIIAKWKEQSLDTNGRFVRHLDGNRANCYVNNLAWVELSDALRNIDSWDVDWDANLTDREIALVRTPAWREGLRWN